MWETHTCSKGWQVEQVCVSRCCRSQYFCWKYVFSTMATSIIWAHQARLMVLVVSHGMVKWHWLNVKNKKSKIPTFPWHLFWLSPPSNHGMKWVHFLHENKRYFDPWKEKLKSFLFGSEKNVFFNYYSLFSWGEKVLAPRVSSWIRPLGKGLVPLVSAKSSL